MSQALVRAVEPLSITRATRYVIRRDFWSFFERTFRVLTPDGQLLMLVRRPLARLREEMIVWGDEARQRGLLRIKARQLIAINYSFDVSDAATGEPLGAVQKRGLRSLFRDRFLILDPAGTEIGHMEEQGASWLRRLFPILTSSHAIVVGGRPVAAIRQRFRFFNKEFEVELGPSELDARFVLACALLAVMSESRREDQN